MPRQKRFKAEPVDPYALSEGTKEIAAYVAMVVRNEMEDFHVKHLSNAQMAELNPIIRDAICTALHAWLIAPDSPEASAFAGWHRAMIPEYWEEPQLTDSYRELVEYRRTGKLPSSPGIRS